MRNPLGQGNMENTKSRRAKLSYMKFAERPLPKTLFSFMYIILSIGRLGFPY